MNHVKRVGALFTAFCALAASAFGGANVAFAANSNSSVVPDQVQRGGVAVVKYDAETKDCTKPQGGADLAGAEFTITNNSDHAIVFADENGKKTTYMQGESWVIPTKKVTDKSSPFYGKYVAMTSAKALPYGTYHIQETKGSAGYGLATKENFLNHKYVPGYVTANMRKWVDTGYDFQITKDGQFVTFDGENTKVQTVDAEGKSYLAGPAAYNPLIRGGIEVLKRDHDLLRATAQGNASLEGGTFVIYNYNTYPVLVWDHFDQTSTPPSSPAGDHGEAQSSYHGVVAEKQTVTLRSGETISTDVDENGWVKPGGIVAIIQTGDDGRAQTFMDALPVGWYTIVEREAPEGYVREERWQSYVQVTNDDWDALVVTDCDDPVLRGAAQVQKFDATLLADETYAFTAGEAQGDGSLAGAHIAIYNNSGRDVWIREADFKDTSRGVAYNTGDVSGISGRVAPGNKVAEIVTNEQGLATIKGLPYGDYYAVEVSPSYGYALNEDWRWDFTIADSKLGKCDADGQQIVAKADGAKAGEKPGDETGLPQVPKETHAPASIWKIDAETGKPFSLVDGLYFDMSFRVINSSVGPIMFNGVRYEPDDVIGVFETDLDDGTVHFDGEAADRGHYPKLPAGTYTAIEERNPEGYVKDPTPHDFTVIDEDGALNSKGFEFKDQVIREDIQFQKVDAETSKPLSGVPFLLEKLDKDGNVMERHILVTDEDGMVDTSGDISGYQGWRARMKDGEPHYNLADSYYDEATGEFTYVAPFADKEAVLAELNGDGTEENPGLIAELDALVAQLNELLTKANVEGIATLYDELTQIVREANAIAAEQGDDSPEYAAKIAEQADKIVEIHEAIAAAKAAAGDDYAEQIDLLEAAIKAKEAEIEDAQNRLAAIDNELSGDAAIWETGYWFFGGEKGDGIEPNETDGALPYGDYRLTELRCEANKGYDLMSRDIHIKRGHGMVENYGTIDNKPYDDCDPCSDETVHGLDVDMHKDSNPAPNSVVKSGSDITYTLSYENTSAEKVNYLLVRDEIPESTTFKSAANDGVYVKDGNYVEWVVKDVEPGATGTVSFTVTVNKGARSVISNQARFGTYKTEVVAGGDNEIPTGSTNIVKHSTDGTPTGGYLSATKRSDPKSGETVKIGDTITYYVDVTNLGDTAMESVAVVDTIPVGTTLASGVDENYYDVDLVSDGGYRIGADMVGWNVGTLAAGETKTVSFTVTVNDDVRYSVSNQATFGSYRGKCTGLLSNTTNVVTHKVETLPELTITKTADRDRTTVPGEVITYTLHVENNGRGNAVNVPVYDIIPEGTQYVMGSISTDVHADEDHTYPFTAIEGEGAGDGTDVVEAKPYVNWTIPVLYNRGGSMDLTYQVRVRDDVEPGFIIANRATVGGEGPASVDTEEPTVTTDVTKSAVSNLVEHEVLDGSDDITVTKTADPADGSSVAPGQEITYTITATNDGEHSAYGFGIRDAIPEHTTFKDGSIVVTGADGKTSEEIAKEAQQQTEEGDECGSVPDDTSIVWLPEAMLNVGNMNEADAEGIYKIVVPDEAHYKIYSWGTIKRALTHLGVGESIEFEVTSDDGYNLYWRATYMEDGRLLLWKRVLVPNATDSVNYTRANGVYANYDQKWDDVYAITDELKPGETITLTFTVIVDEDVTDNTEIVNVATYGDGVYSAPCFDLEHESNSTTHVVGTPHLVAEKTVDKADARRGDVLTYTVKVTNDGTARAKDVAIHDEFRTAEALNGLTYVVGSWNVSGADGATASAGMASNFDAATRFVAARCNTLEPGDTLTMTFQCLVADAVDGDIITNKATWSANHEGDPIYGDLENETNEVSTLIGEPKVSVTKTVEPEDGSTVEVGDTLTYNFTLTNDSAVATDTAAVFDMVPTYTTYVDGSATGGLEVIYADVELPEGFNPETDEAPAPVAVAVGLGGIHLEPGESRDFSFKVSVDPTLVENVTISNTATGGFSAETPTMPLQVSSNTTVNDAVAPDTELRIIKSATPEGGTELAVGDEITYTIVAMNESTTPAKDVCVFDFIPEHTSFVKGSETGGLKYVAKGLEGDRDAVIATGLTLGAHERIEMTFKVTVDDTLEDLIVANRATIGEFRGNPTAPLEIASNEVISSVVAPKPAISITDESDPASGTQVKAGDIITYNFKVTETEGVVASGIAVFDYVPANTTFVEGSETGGLKLIRNAAGTVIAVYADDINLMANGSKEFSFQVEVGTVTSDTEIANQPTAGFASEPKLPLAQVAETMTHTIIAEKPVLRITKTATPGAGTAVSAGDTIDYSFTVMNDSEAIARGVAVFDRVPENTTYVAGSADGLTEIVDESGNVVALYADSITLAAHRSRSFGFAVTVNDGDDLIVSNRATCGFAEAPTTDLEIDSNEVMHGSATPDVRVTKAATPAEGTIMEPGDVITYDITVKNASTGDDRDVQVYDKIPAGTTYVEGSLSAKGATEAKFADGAIVARYDKVEGKDTHHIIFKVIINDEFSGDIANIATFGHGEGLPTAELDEKTNATTNISVADEPLLRIEQTSDPKNGAAVSEDDVITYTIKLTNIGEGNAHGAAIRDAIPEQLELVSASENWELADGALVASGLELASGESMTFTFDARVIGEAGSTIANRATCGFAADVTKDLELDSNENVHVVSAPELRVTKASKPGVGATISDGDEITYTITVKNAGAGLDKNVAVFDRLPEGMTYVDGSLVAEGADQATFAEGAVAVRYAKLAGGETRTITFKATADAEFDGQLANVATFGHSDDLPTSELENKTNATSTMVSAKQPLVRISQVSDPVNGTAVAKGDEITYTITVKNDGLGAAHGVAVFDRVPEHTEFVSADGLDYADGAVKISGLDIAAGESETFSFTVRVIDGGEIIVSNRASAGFADDPTDELEIDSNEVVHGVAMPDVKVAKSSDAGETVTGGDVITYTIKLANAGNGVAENVGIYDVIPAGTTYVEGSLKAKSATEATFADGAIAARYAKLGAGRSATITFKVTVNDDFGGVLSNQATYGAAETLPTAPLSDFTNASTTTAVAKQPLLRIEQASQPANGTAVADGEEIAYTITVFNDGEADARGVAIFDRLPEHSEFVSAKGLNFDEEHGILTADGITIAAGDSMSVSFKVKASGNGGEIVANRATAGFATAPVAELELDSGETVNQIAAADMRVTKTATPGADATLSSGDEITYTIKVTNAGAGVAKDFGVYDAIPAGTTYVDGSLVAEGAIVNAPIKVDAVAARYDRIEPGEERTITFKVTVDAGTDGMIQNFATYGDAPELPVAPLGDYTNTVINNAKAAAPALRITKSATPGAGTVLSVGDEITYTVTVANDGDGKATGVAVFDRIPVHTTYVEGSAQGLTLTEDGSALYADGLEIAAGESKTFSFKAAVVDEGVIITNRATCGFAKNPTSDLDIDSNEVVNSAEAPNTEIAISANPVDGSAVTPGSDITYTVTLRNTGRGADRDVAVFAPIPAGTAYVEGTLSADGAESIAQTTDGTVTGIAAHYDSLEAKSTKVITYTVRVLDDADATINAHATMGHMAQLATAELEILSNNVSHILDKAPVLSIVKTQEPGNGAWVAGGDELTYHITVTNEGNTIARKVGVYDEAPEHTTYVAGSLTTDRGNVYEGTDGLLTNIAGDLKPGDSVTMTFKVRIDLGFVGTIYNRAMWVSPAADPENVVNNDAQGANQDANAASDPAEGQGAAAPAATVVPSTRLLGVLGATVPIPEGSYSGISNEVTAGGGDTPSEPSTPEIPDTPDTPSTPDTPEVPDKPENPDTPETPAGDSGSNEVNAGVKAPQVTITKTANPAGTIKSGSVVTYTIRMENTGDVNANMLYMRDTLPEGVTFQAGTVTVSGMTYEVKDGNIVGRCSLKPGEVATVTFKAKVGSDFSGDIVNVAEWGQAETGKVPTKMLGSTKVSNTVETDTLGGDSNEVNAYVNKPTIQLVKTSDPEDGSIVKPGTKVTYTLAATNVGRVNANNLYILDEIPEGLTVDAESVKGEGLVATFADGKLVARGSLRPTESGTVTFEATVGKDFVGDIMNQAKWGQADEGKEPENFDGNSNEDLIHVGTTEVELIKSCDHADGTFVSRGSKLTYTIEAENKGTLDVDMVVTDKVPEGTTFESFETVGGKGEITSDPDGTISFKPGNLKPGEKAAFKFTVTVDADAIGDIRNVANWTDGGENSGESNSIIHHVSDPKISVTKTDNSDGGKVRIGDVVSYSIHITNSGTTEGIVRMTDVIPEGLELDKNSVRVTCSNLTDKVVFEGEEDKAVAAEGETASDIIVDVRDDSPFGALANAFTAFVNWLTGEPTSESSIVVDGGSLKGAFSVKAGETVAVTYDAKVSEKVAAGVEIKNVVDVEAEGGDPSHAEDVVKAGNPVLSISKAATIDNGGKSTAKPGSVITYRLSADNVGSATSDVATIRDTIPANTTYVKGSAKVVSSTDATKDLGIAEENLVVTKDGKVTEVAYVVGDIKPGELTDTLVFQVKVNDFKENGEVKNVGHIVTEKAGQDKPTMDVPSNEIVTPVEVEKTPTPTPTPTPTNGAKLSIKKIAIDANGKETTTYTAGSQQAWKITVSNTGDETASGVKLVDLFGNGLTFVKATDASGKVLAADISGKASTASDYASKIASSSKSFQNNDGSYSLGASQFKDGYLYGSATDGLSANDYATGIPMGNYNVTIASGYRGVVQVIAMDDSGKVDSTRGSQGTLGYSTSGSNLNVTVPENGRLVITCQKESNGTWVDATTAEHPFNFAPTGEISLPSTSSDDYAATFVLGDIKAGDSATVTVITKTVSNGPSQITNTAKAYIGANDSNAVTDKATVTRTSGTTEKKPTNPTEKLPSTAAAIGGLVVLAGGIAGVTYGVRKLRRKDEGDGDNATA